MLSSVLSSRIRQRRQQPRPTCESVGDPREGRNDVAMTESDAQGRTPLHYAALAKDADECEARLTAGHDPDSRDSKGFTPLHFAAQEGAVDVARVLLGHGASVDATNDFGNTPLFTAVFNSRGDGSVIALLREHGADPHKANNSGQTPAGLASLIANYDVAQFFSDVT